MDRTEICEKEYIDTGLKLDRDGHLTLICLYSMNT